MANKFTPDINSLIQTLRRQGIFDENILNAFKKVPRENFISDSLADKAYENEPLSIPYGQTISQPFTVAYMVSLLDIKLNDKILEIGTGSGYEAAILSELGAKVYSVERIPELGKYASDNLQRLNYDVKIYIGDGSLGWDEYAPYRGIIVSAASPDIPKSLVRQLDNGGKIVIPIGKRYSQKMYRGIKNIINGKEEMKYSSYDNFTFVPLIGKEGFDE